MPNDPSKEFVGDRFGIIPKRIQFGTQEIGGTPEGIIAACAMKCLGGTIQAILHPRDEKEREQAIAHGMDLKKVLTTNDLVSGDDVFFAATGITDGELLRGIRYGERYIKSNSLVMRSRSKTIRVIESEHPLQS